MVWCGGNGTWCGVVGVARSVVQWGGKVCVCVCVGGGDKVWWEWVEQGTVTPRKCHPYSDSIGVKGLHCVPKHTLHFLVGW